MRHRILPGIVGMLLVFAGWGLASAQGTELDEEQLALLDRVFAARERLDTFESYVEEGTGTETQRLTIELGDQALELRDSTEWSRTQTVINTADGKNVQSELRASVIGEDWPAYAVTAQARHVEGTLYVSAVYEEPGADLPPLPDGWISVEELEALEDEFPAFDALQLDSIADDEPSPLLEDQERFRTTATDVRLETVTLEDGTTAEQISVIFGRDGLLNVITEDAEDPFEVALFSELSDASQATLIVVLDDEGRALQVRTEFFLAVEQMDAAALSPEDFPAGTLLSFTFAGVEAQSYSQINESFEPVLAPEELVETPAG